MNDFAALAFSLGRDVHAEVKTSLGDDYATLTLEQMQSNSKSADWQVSADELAALNAVLDDTPG